jgi:hypothetical protein
MDVPDMPWGCPSAPEAQILALCAGADGGSGTNTEEKISALRNVWAQSTLKVGNVT